VRIYDRSFKLGFRNFVARIIYYIDKIFPSPNIGGRGGEGAYSRWEYEVGKDLIASYPRYLGKLSGKLLLDAGCGPGGKTVAYAEEGARAVGVDISVDNIRAAERFSISKGMGLYPVFITASVELLPFENGAFDIVVANDSMEHFSNPSQAISELGRVVKSGGLIVIFFTPWTSPLGSHLYDYIKTPWCHLVYPEWLIEELLKLVLQGRGERDASSIAGQLMNEYREELNRITVDEFEEIIANHPEFKIVYRKFIAPKYNFLSRLTSLPFVGKYLINTVVVVLKKL